MMQKASFSVLEFTASNFPSTTNVDQELRVAGTITGLSFSYVNMGAQFIVESPPIQRE